MAVPLCIRLLHDGAVAPAYHSAHAAGLDLGAAPADGNAIVIPPGGIRLVPCGFAMSLPSGYEAQVRPRSGLASRYGVTLVNSPGTIDADYRGEVCVPLINHGSEAFVVEPGMRIAQMVIAAVASVSVRVVAELGETDRGEGGFGSTGA